MSCWSRQGVRPGQQDPRSPFPPRHAHNSSQEMEKGDLAPGSDRCQPAAREGFGRHHAVGHGVLRALPAGTCEHSSDGGL